jgi:hypothetical protein
MKLERPFVAAAQDVGTMDRDLRDGATGEQPLQVARDRFGLR